MSKQKKRVKQSYFEQNIIVFPRYDMKLRKKGGVWEKESLDNNNNNNNNAFHDRDAFAGGPQAAAAAIPLDAAVSEAGHTSRARSRWKENENKKYI